MQSTLLPDVLRSLRRLAAFSSEAHDSGSESDVNLRIAGVAKACLADAEVGSGWYGPLAAKLGPREIPHIVRRINGAPRGSIDTLELRAQLEVHANVTR